MTLYTLHALHTLLTSQAFVLTNTRKTGYKAILAAPELTIESCNRINLAEKIVLPNERTSHECVEEKKKAQTLAKAQLVITLLTGTKQGIQ